MRNLLFTLLLFPCLLFSQVIDRYPYIQKPTETSALIAWNTATAGLGTIHWGETPGSLTNTLSEAAASQKHAITLSGLSPNTQYFYQATTSTGYQSAVEHFWTAKPLPVRNIQFLHYADCGYNNTTQNQLSALMEQEDVDFAVVAGDVDQGSGDAYDDVFFGVYQDMLAHDCHYTAIGNHDIIANGGADFFDSFYQPTNNLQQSEHYYSFTWGHAKFICLDSNGDYSIGSDQHDFLINELKCNDQEWLFVYMHHPPWTNAWDLSYYIPFQPYYQYDGNDDMRTALVPYFEQYGVDFVLNGHSHCYQRGEYNGVHYVISGGGGTSTLDQHTCMTSPSNLACSPNITTEIYVNEYVRFRVNGDTLTYAAVSISGAVVDSVVVTKTWTPYDVVITTNANTNGSNANGSALATVQGPYPPYTFIWTSGATTANATNLWGADYTVSITDGHGCTRTQTVTVDGLTKNEDPVTTALRIFPNPFETNCVVEFSNPGQEAMTLELWDLSGKKVMQMENIRSERVVLERKGLPSGMYMVRLLGNAGIFSAKVALD